MAICVTMYSYLSISQPNTLTFNLNLSVYSFNESNILIESLTHLKQNVNTTFSNGCLGSHNDEERSEMRYVMRIARLRESSKF